MFIDVNKYYKMSNAELENEATKWNIHEYGNASGSISRRIIIDQLIQKDKANDSRHAVCISLASLVLSIIAIIVSGLYYFLDI